MKNERLKRLLFIGIIVVPVVTLLSAYTEYSSIKPTVNLGRAEIIKPAYGEIPLVKFPNGKLAAAEIKNAVPGDNVTIFLDDKKVTNAPADHKFGYLFALLAGFINGLFLTYLINLVVPKTITAKFNRKKAIA